MRNNERNKWKQAKAGSRPNSRRGARGGKSNTGVIVAALIVGVGALVALTWWLAGPGPSWDRKTLDDYVASQRREPTMNPGAAVYIDFSDGMQYGYGSDQARRLLASVVNKLSGVSSGVDFFALADDKITPLALAQTEVYNTIMNGANYTMQRAPIEKTLARIVQARQPALLVTDFEEYNGAVIQQQNYAKDYFTEWLAAGYNITFYKLDYNENGRAKRLFFAVFDDQQGPLDALVAQAVSQARCPSVGRFVLGSPEYAFPIVSCYLSTKQGGNYHDSEGVDQVSGVIEDGGPQAFVSYCAPMATADAGASRGNYAPQRELHGPIAQYYPLTVTWPEILETARSLQEEGVPPGDIYRHFLGGIFVDFTAQDGYDIRQIEARAFNVESVFAQPGDEDCDGGGEAKKPSEADAPEVADMFTAALLPAPPGLPRGWQEMVVDFDQKFDGDFPAGTPRPDDMLKVNVVVSQAVPRMAQVEAFFAWPGNRSLAESVTNALASPLVNPRGRVLVSYYMKLVN